MDESGQEPVDAGGSGAVRIGSGRIGIDYVVCDVFTPRGLAGNQLAVFEHAQALGDDLRGALAREMNYSESVFVTPGDDSADARLWIYTPAGELPFAGHPVLGAAAVLAQAGDRSFVLRTNVGPVNVWVSAAGPSRAQACMEQPWPERVDVDADLVRTGLRAGTGLAVAGYDNGARYALVELQDRADVAALEPDLAAIGRLSHGLLLFAGAGTSWKARMFAPSVGVAEDPATGSAAGPLAVHLHCNGRLETGQTIEIEQGAEVGRPSLLRATVRAAGADGLRVHVGGHVVIVARGAFSLQRHDIDLLGSR